MATRADADAIRRIELAAAGVPGLLVSWPDDIGRKDYVRFLDALVPSGLVKVAESAGAVVGHAYLDRMDMPAVRHIARLTTVVDLGHLGQGIGSRLLASLIDAGCAVPELRKIELLVRAANERAIRLYRRHGFEPEGLLRSRVLTTAGAYVDDVAMGLMLR